MRLKQAQEVKEAAIEGLDTCEFCDYSVILAPDCKTVDCQNPECKKQTCRSDIYYIFIILYGICSCVINMRQYLVYFKRLCVLRPVSQLNKIIIR